jgi:hypothetical protein
VIAALPCLHVHVDGATAAWFLAGVAAGISVCVGALVWLGARTGGRS